MKTLHFISLKNCFVSIHVVERFTHAYRDFVANNDYAIFIQIEEFPIIGFYLYHVTSAGQSSNWTTSGI